MKNIICVISLLLVFCSSTIDPHILFQAETLQPDDILGEWYRVDKPYVGVSGGVMVVMSDTIIWKLCREGQFIFDSLVFIKEYHSASLIPNQVGIPQQYGKVIYESGQNSEELNYGMLKFRMSTYDSLTIYFAGQWESFSRKH